MVGKIYLTVLGLIAITITILATGCAGAHMSVVSPVTQQRKPPTRDDIPPRHYDEYPVDYVQTLFAGCLEQGDDKTYCLCVLWHITDENMFKEIVNLDHEGLVRIATDVALVCTAETGDRPSDTDTMLSPGDPLKRCTTKCHGDRVCIRKCISVVDPEALEAEY
jgi:hypothetical protein